MSRIVDKLRPTCAAEDTNPDGRAGAMQNMNEPVSASEHAGFRPVDNVASPRARLKSVRERLSANGSVQWSPDLARVLELPRRPKPDLNALVATMTARFKRPGGTQTLFPMQAWALHEGPKMEGLFGSIQIGAGKTLISLLMPMAMPDCRRAVLLIPPSLRAQLLQQDWPFYSKHWVLPNLAGGEKFVTGRPVLHVIAYSELSSPKASEMLAKLDPDLLIWDECHNLRHYTSARTKRALRFLAARSGVRVCAWTGTPLSRSVRDSAHLFAVTLGGGSPMPISTSAVDEWANALDPGENSFSPGALSKFCNPGEEVREGFRRRKEDTEGVVSSADQMLLASLVFYEHKVPAVPGEITKHLRELRRSPNDGGWKRPDGEELTDQLQVNRCARQLAHGLYMKWVFPRNEPLELRTRWFARRQEFNRELRAKLQRAEPHLDSPFLCGRAAQRWYDGGCSGCHREALQWHDDDCAMAAEAPVWNSDCWPAWHEVANQVYHETEVVWESDYLVDAVAAWAAESPGIVWVEYPEFGARLAKKARLPYYPGGTAASERILGEDGSRSIIASIKSHATGKNLQRFHRNWMAPMTDAALTEQLAGRTHRPGQEAEEVEMWFCKPTRELDEALLSAKTRSKFLHQLESPQRLTYGTWSF